MIQFAVKAQRDWHVGIEHGLVFEDNRVIDFGNFLVNRPFFARFTGGLVCEKEISNKIDIESGILFREPELDFKPRHFTKVNIPLRTSFHALVFTIPLKASHSYELVRNKIKLYSTYGLKFNFLDQAEDVILRPIAPWSDNEAGIEYVDYIARTRIRSTWLTGVVGFGNKIGVTSLISAYWRADYTFGWKDIATSEVTYKLEGESERTAKVDSRDNHWSIVGGIRLNLTNLKN